MWFLHAKPWPYGNRKVNYHMLRSDITNMCCFPSKQCMGHFLMIFMWTINVCMRKHPYTSPIHYHSYVHNTFSYKVTSNTPYHVSHMPFWKVNYWWGIIEWQLWESLNKNSFATQLLKADLIWQPLYAIRRTNIFTANFKNHKCTSHWCMSHI